ncbi:MAG: ABC transporter ATP-binding protein [Saprospiraceae bacterium]
MFNISVLGISKSYNNGSVTALSNITFDVNKGELFGLIGPDGAGKTTLFRILTTLLLPDSGSAKVNGLDIIRDYKEIRKKVGYMPGKFSLYQDLSVEENLNFFATIFNTTVAQNYDLIKEIYVQLEPFKKRRAGNLSGGMKQKLALCCALIHRPQIILLDEPTTGVDTVSRKEFWIMLKRLKEEGITVLVSTPYMDEANLCDRIALIQNGKIMSIDTPKEITKKFPRTLYAIKSYEMSRLLSDLRLNKMVHSVYAFGEYHHLSFSKRINGKNEPLNNFLEGLNHTNMKFFQIKPSVEDCFIDLMTKQEDHDD